MTDVKSTTGVTADEVLAYVAENYISLEQLATQTQVSAERITDLIAAECVPPHAYDITGEITISSAFGAFRQPMTPRRVYPPSLMAWIRRAEPLAREIGLERAARQIRTEFLTPIAKALPNRWPGGPEEAWALLRDGSWGLCLKEITPQNAITKESVRIAVAAHGAPAQDGPEPLRAEIAKYDAVTLPFAPHERPESSRSREIDPVRAAPACAISDQHVPHQGRT
jgi:hypothetical protein